MSALSSTAGLLLQNERVEGKQKGQEKWQDSISVLYPCQIYLQSGLVLIRNMSASLRKEWGGGVLFIVFETLR